MKKKVTILFCLLLIFSGIFMVKFQENSHAEAVKNISGIVSLPNNEVAPAGGIKIMIRGNGDAGGYKSTNVTIAAGAKSASYTLSLPQNIKDQAFRISYSIQSEGNSYVSSGYYGGTSYSEASWVDLSSNNINIALLKGKRISGTISLPDKKVAPAGGIEISVDANSDSKNVYTDTVIPAGKNSASYTVCVPADAENQKWQIEYSIDSNGYGYGCVNDGHYGGNISPKLVDTKNGDVKDINIAILKGKAISGKISLPNNEVAPSGGRSIDIYAENDNSDGEDTYVNTGSSIEIPEGKNSAQYTIYVPEDVKKQEWRVRYSLDLDGYVKEGYYGGNNYDSASLVSTAKGSVDGINIAVLKGNAISGIVSLPNKEVASSKGMRISINAEGESGDNYSDVVIPPGRNSASYTLYVPKDAKDQNWKVRYYINSNYPQYVKEGYYGGSSYESATPVNASSGNIKGVNMSIFKAKIISGNISLPNNAVAPTGGMRISVNASNSSGSHGYADVTIPAGKNSVSYELGVSADIKDTTWRISYYINSNASGYVSNGYYGGSDYNSAKLVDIASGDAKNINISLVKAKVISGNISLPNNAVAPTGGMRISVNASNSSGSGYTDVTIPAGKNSVSYEIGVSPNTKDTKWKISYYINSNASGYVSNGYYGGSDYNSAKLVDIASGDVKNINISLVKAKVISGSISLPNNAVAPAGGMKISLNASNSSESGYADVTIPAGKNSVSYEIGVSPNTKDTKWKISYYINSNASGYVSNGYYGGSDYNSAKLVDIASGDVKNINISLVKAKVISGSISLPNNAVAPAGGISISVNASNNGGSGYANAYVTIPAGKNSVSYEVSVLPNIKDTKWRISYSIPSNVSGYILNGYYGGSDYSSAKLVDVASGDAKNINISLVKAKVISGTISLPNNAVAPVGGMSISINASNNSGSGYTNVTIPAGKNSVSYEISVLPNTKDTTWKINYNIQSNGNGYVSSGYYGGSDYSSAKLVNVASGDAKNINIALTKAKVISGSISLPNNAVAPTGGISISVNASNNGGSGYANAYVTIPAGKNSVSYEISVLPNIKDTKWRISYSIPSNVSGYVSNGYYGGSDYSSAKLVDIANGDAKNINISLTKAKVISGTISLPNNAVAPTGGMSISVNASNSSGSGYASVTIPAGKNSVSYEIAVSPNTKDTKWTIGYYIGSNASGYVSNGYYGGSDYSSAKLVDIASGDAKNINISLTKAKVISGTISLPNNAVAPAGGMRISVNASNNSGSGYADVTIPEGKSSVPYEISVSPNAKDTTWRISYYINSNGSGYVSNGYYGGSDYSSAKLVTVASGDAKNINIALTKAKTISGNISLPNNAVAPAGGMSIYINASNSNGSGSFANVIIPAGKNSVSYEMGIAPNTKDTKWKISYNIQSGGSEYVSNGYYGGSDYSSAKLVDVASGDAKNINIPLIKAKVISGSISLPNNAVAPTGGIDISVNASNNGGSGSGYASVKIPAGKNSTSYEMYVSPNTKDTTWRINYYINSGANGYVSNGYYGGSDYSSAKLVDVASGDAKNINIPLIKSKVISGNISLPNNAVAPTGGIYISVNASNNGGSGSGYASVIIPAGKNSVSYEMYVLPNTKDTKWKISYSIQSNVSGYVSYGYYGGSEYNSAKFVDVASGDAKNINISLAKANINNQAEATVTTKAAVEITGVTLNKTTDVLKVGGTDTLVATVLPATATNKNVIWTTSNSNIATVDKTGKITAVGTGTAKITVTTENGSKTSVCNVTVNPSVAVTAVTGVTLNKTTDVLKVGETDTLSATVAPATATNKNVIWTTSNSNVATVDKTGKITAVGVGTAKITVTTENGSKTSVCTVTVNPAIAATGVTWVRVSKPEAVLTVGGTDTLKGIVSPATATNKNVIWTTSNSNVATVDKTGKITAVGVGTAKITVTTEDGSKTSVCYVTVNPAIAVTGVRLSKTADVLTVGGTDTLAAIVAPATATNKNVIWTTSNSNVATVDKNGKITAVGTGTAKITVTTANGSKTSVCDVTVNPAVAATLSKK